MGKHDFAAVNRRAFAVLQENIRVGESELRTNVKTQKERKEIAILNALSHFCSETLQWDRELCKRLAISILEDVILHEAREGKVV